MLECGGEVEVAKFSQAWLVAEIEKFQSFELRPSMSVCVIEVHN